MSHFKIDILFILLLICDICFSSEEEPKKAEPHPTEINYSGQQDTHWMVLQNDLAALKTKIDADKKTLDELILAQRVNSKNLPTDHAQQLKHKHQDFRKLNQEYNFKLKEFETKYPEKGIELGRIYKRKKVQTIEQMESNLMDQSAAQSSGQLTLDGRIQKINKKIKSQFQVVEPIKSADKKQHINTKTEESLEKSDQKTTPEVTDKLNIVK
jgi:transketolase